MSEEEQQQQERQRRNANEQLRDDAMRHAGAVARWERGLQRKVENFVNQELVPDLVEQAQKAEGATDWQVQRVQRALASIDRIAQQGMVQLYELVESELEDFAQMQAEWQQRQLRRVRMLGIDLNAPSMEAVRAVVKNSPIEGATLKQWAEQLGRQASDRVRRSLSVGIVQGEAPAQLRRRVRDATRVSRKEATAIARTAANTVSNQARRQSLEANEDVIKAYRYVATLDDRTTVLCASLDGTVWTNKDDVRWPPLHVNCRSQVVPVLKGWRELGLDEDDLPASTRASMDGQVPEHTTYEEWLRNQPEAVQREALGKGRWELWKQHDMSMGEMVGPGGKPLTLRELRQRAGVD